jgi:hypothetical protein
MIAEMNLIGAGNNPDVAAAVVRWQRERFRNSGLACQSKRGSREGGPASRQRYAGSLCRWQWRTRSGARRGSTVNSRCSASRSQKGPSLAFCALFPNRRPRAARHSSTTMSVRSCQLTSLPYRRSRSKCCTSLSCSLIAAARSCTLM